jgi:CDP-glucose 4,6-dehydratase
MAMNDDLRKVYGNRTVLITGDTGFKGSWLAMWLRYLGANVIGYSLPPATDDDNYVVCGVEEKITHIDGDIRDRKSLVRAFSSHEPEIVFHLAAQPLVQESYRSPARTFETNVMGTVNVLEAVRSSPSVKAVVSVASDKCYDNKEWIYGYREVDPLGGKDPYSASKAAAEIATHSYIHSFFSEEDTANVASARAGNVIGGGDWAPDRIVPDCMRALFAGGVIRLRNPDAVRPWQHVLEPLYGYLSLGSALYCYGRQFSGPWNFGPAAKNMITVRQLVERVISEWGCGSVMDDGSSGSRPESGVLCLDISKAVNKLGWRPLLDFDHMVRMAVEEYRIQGADREAVYRQRVRHIEEYYRITQGKVMLNAILPIMQQ